jgi:hypothetical protein
LVPFLGFDRLFFFIEIPASPAMRIVVGKARANDYR